MSPEKRSAVMSRIRGKNTGIEEIVAGLLSSRGMVFERHARDLPGRPDFVLREDRVVVFVDGDFWHGWRFPLWRDKLSEKWEAKIDETRKRDQRNHRKLRDMGWKVVRLWEHQIEKDSGSCIEKVIVAIGQNASNLRWLQKPGEMRIYCLFGRQKVEDRCPFWYYVFIRTNITTRKDRRK